MWQYRYTDEIEIYHHGILGMKWGVRRYQNPDGTLTPAGRRKANRLAGQYAKVTGKKLIIKKKSVTPTKEKTISEMSDEDLKKKINRFELEKTYNRMLAERAPKQKVSKGKKFVNKVASDVLAPAAIDAGRKSVTKAFNRLFDKVLNDIDKESKKSNKKKDEELKKKLITAAVSDKGKKYTKKAYKKTVTETDLGKITVDGIVYKKLDKYNKNK